MKLAHDGARRAVMAALAALPLGSSAAQLPHTLVAYMSRSGNTRVVAGLIQRARRADLFEILPASPYPADYLETVEQARQERDSGHEPALQARVPRMADYGLVFLGFPIWGGTAPPLVRAFLSQHALSGKTLIPFITHGGYGLGDSLSVLARHAPKARLLPGFSLQADQERRTMEQVTRWLRGVTPA